MTKRVTDDGWEEEVYEEWEEEEVKVKSTTIVTAADSEERERVAGGVTSKQTTESVSSDQSSRWSLRHVTFHASLSYIVLLQGQGWQDPGGEEQLRQESREQRDHYSYTGQCFLPCGKVSKNSLHCCIIS